MKEKSVYIYGLKDPRTQEVRYIGKTRDPELRLRQHLNTQFEGPNPLEYIWISGLLEQGIRPEMVILHTATTHREAVRSENTAIKEYSKQFSLISEITGELRHIHKFDKVFINTIQAPVEVWRDFKILCVAENKSIKAKVNEMILKEIGGKK